MYYYRLISSMLKAVISTLGTGLYAVYKGENDALASLTTSLYAVYKAESNANDSLLNYNGTAQGGLTYTAGKSGNAFVFNGTTAYVQLPDNSLNSLTGSFSVSSWFKTASSIQNLENYIIHNTSMTTWYNNPNGFYIIQYGNAIGFRIFNNTNTYADLAVSYTLSANTWYNVTATKQLNGSMNLYLNGTLIGTTVTSVNPTYLATVSKPTIGAINIPNRSPSIGYYAQNGFQVDELNIWNKELTATEVTDLYNSGNGKFYQNNAFYSTVVNDSLGTYNGTAQGGLTYTAGKSGNAFTFNGSNAYVDLGNNTINLGSTFSISCWINTTAQGSYNIILENYVANFGFALYIQGNGVRFSTYNGTSGALVRTTNIVVGSNNTWYHIVVTKSASVAPLIYVNGSSQALTTVTGTPSNNPAYNASCRSLIGVEYDGVFGGYFNGKIDEVNTWNKELTSTEVTELYNAGTGKFYPY